MFFISHRGNLTGPSITNENHPEYIQNAISEGFDVEIDIREYKGKLYLGHDEPQYEISKEFVKNKKLWCHAKDIDALWTLKNLNTIFFWHERDSYTLTSNGYFWTYPGINLIKNSICVLPENHNYKNIDCSGICSDYIIKFCKND
jgi:hypothetical protein